jgi:glycosyltransferase involved in cell wall biosynthesis
MRIGIICPNFPPARFEGGISHFSELLAKSLAKLGHDIYAFASTEFSKSTSNPSSSEDINIIRIKGPWRYGSVKIIKNISVNENIDALILQYAPASYRKSFRLKWTLTKFPCEKLTAFHALYGKDIDRLWGFLMLMGNSKIIATNSEIVHIIEKRFPFLLKKTSWIPIGSNIQLNSVLNEHEKSDDPIITYFGMMYPGKGLDLVLDVLEKLKNRKNRFHFNFIGGGIIYYPNYQNEFRKKIKKRGLNEIVDYLGFVPDNEVSKWLTMSRFIFLPYDRGISDRRGTFMAAISHRKPVLTSPPTIPIPFLKNGVNVLWPVEVLIDKYVECAESLLNDDSLVLKLEKGAETLANKLNWEKIAADYAILLQH